MADIKQEIFDYLKSQGLQPEETPFGIYFKYQMLNFLVFHEDEDSQFFRIALPGIFDVDGNNRTDALEAVNKTNKSIKVAKALIPDDDVWIATEHLLDADPKYDDIIPRSLHILIQARGVFYDALREE